MEFFCTFYFRFSGNTAQTLLFSLIYSATAFAILSPGLVPADVLWAGQAANIPMIVVGKLIQVYSNFSQGHTGQLSAVTVILLTLGKFLFDFEIPSIFHILCQFQDPWHEFLLLGKKLETKLSF